MSRPLLASCALALLAAASLSTPAAAQTPAASATQDLKIQVLQSGPVAAPEVRFGKINGRDATLAGGSAGWLTDHKLFIGGAGYWLANGDDGFAMHYGGALVRWTFRGDGPVGLSTGVLLGLGTATMTRPYGDVFGAPASTTTTAPSGRVTAPALRGNASLRFGGTSRVTSATPVRIHDDYVLAEPQLTAVVKIAPWLRLEAGGGYRFVGASDLLDRQLRGATASVALRFGGR